MIKKTVKTNQSSDKPEPFERLPEREKIPFGERLTRNLALAGMVLLALIAVRNEQLPTGQTVLEAIRQITEPEWDETLGKISFVSTLFPDTASVFFDTSLEKMPVTTPCFGEISHPWSREEPYLGFQGSDGLVYAAAPGQVMSLAHGMEEEWILRVRHDQGMETLYYNLGQINVREGDEVNEATCLGTVLAGKETVLEVRSGGRAVDPTALLTARETAP